MLKLLDTNVRVYYCYLQQSVNNNATPADKSSSLVIIVYYEECGYCVGLPCALM